MISYSNNVLFLAMRISVWLTEQCFLLIISLSRKANKALQKPGKHGKSHLLFHILPSQGLTQFYFEKAFTVQQTSPIRRGESTGCLLRGQLLSVNDVTNFRRRKLSFIAAGDGVRTNQQVVSTGIPYSSIGRRGRAEPLPGKAVRL